MIATTWRTGIPVGRPIWPRIRRGIEIPESRSSAATEAAQLKVASISI